MSYRDLLELDYVAFDHVMDFKSKLEENSIEDALVDVSSHYDGNDVPVIDVEAWGVGGVLSESYTLHGVSRQDFEELAYDAWTEAFEDEFDIELD